MLKHFSEPVSSGGLGFPESISSGGALQRFIAKCRHDPGTGCVLWTGGTTSGRGHSAPYGAFWFERRRWFAHRWAAQFIHGLSITGHQVDHMCQRTLCVQHLQAIPAALNRELQTTRARAAQSIETRRYWIHVQVGLEPDPPRITDEPFTDIPFFPAPPWMKKPATVGGSLIPF